MIKVPRREIQAASVHAASSINRAVRRCVVRRLQESVMGLAEYMIVSQGEEWGVLHDDSIKNRYATEEALRLKLQWPNLGDP
jgi:hypothetical protein